MKIVASAILVALFSAVNGRFLNAANPAMPVATTYGTATLSNSMNCGQCIGLGNIYCIQKSENVTATTPMTGTSQQRCLAATTTTDSAFTDATWSCSNAFVDRVYAKYVCQFNTAQCGTQQFFNLTTAQNTSAITIPSLTTGQTCMYKVASQCGGTAFTPSQFSNFEIEYVEYRAADVNPTNVITTGSVTSPNRRVQAPMAHMPRRDHYFYGQAGGNNIANAN